MSLNGRGLFFNHGWTRINTDNSSYVWLYLQESLCRPPERVS